MPALVQINHLSPLSTNERLISIDFLRGLAIFGILVVNMPLMFQPITAMLLGAESDPSTINYLSISFIKFFFEGKFYVLFSLLFGFGFSIFMNKTINSEKSVIPIYSRRLFILLLIGILHVIFLWAGDILVFYALFGFTLLLFRNSPDKKIKIWSILLFLIPTIISFISFSLISLASSIPEVQQSIIQESSNRILYLETFYKNALNIYASGSYIEIIRIRLQEYQSLLLGILFFYPVVLSMFLIGFLIERKKVIQNLQNNISKIKKLLYWIIPIGLIANCIYIYSYWNSDISIPSFWTFIQTAMHSISGLLIGLSYAILILLALNKLKKPNLFTKAIASVGKMALTNYLTHSIIAVLLFQSIGFGLTGKIEVWQGLILTVLIYSAQLIFSYQLLKKYKYGPAEWLWKKLTYLKLQKNG